MNLYYFLMQFGYFKSNLPLSDFAMKNQRIRELEIWLKRNKEPYMILLSIDVLHKNSRSCYVMLDSFERLSSIFWMISHYSAACLPSAAFRRTDQTSLMRDKRFSSESCSRCWTRCSPGCNNTCFIMLNISLQGSQFNKWCGLTQKIVLLLKLCETEWCFSADCFL